MKQQLFYVLLIALLFSFTNIVDAQNSKKPKIALVLSGGGAKGFAHIGALKVIEDLGIPIDLIVGNSMGSIVGGMYSIGYTASEIEQFAKSTDWEKLFSDEIERSYFSPDLKLLDQRFLISIPVDEKKRPMIPISIIDGQNVLNLLCGLMANVPDSSDFSTFPVPFVCVGADIVTGKQVVLDNGYLPTAIYASMSIPGVFTPEEHNGYLMVDGGIVNNFPVDIAKQRGADIIIGVDIRNNLHNRADIKSMKQLMDQLMNFYTIDKDTMIKKFCDIHIRPDISGYSASSFSANAVDTLIRRGEEAAMKVCSDIEKLKEQYDYTKPQYINRNFIDNNKWKITDIKISGDFSVSESLIRSKIDLLIPGVYSYEEIKASIDKIYGIGNFKKVYFKLNDSETGKILQLTLREESITNFNVGMRGNSTDAVSLLLNYTQKDYRRYIGYFSITADLSSNPGFDFQSEISRGKLPSLGLRISGKHKRYDLYKGEDKVANADLYYANAKVFTYTALGRSMLIGLGYSGEFYRGDVLSSFADSLGGVDDKRKFLSNLYVYMTNDNLDDYYFPERGTETHLEAGIFDDEKLNNINPFVQLKVRNYVPLHENFTLLLNFYGRAILTPGYPLIKSNYIGGHSYELYFNHHLPFYGVPSMSAADRYAAIALTGVRLHFGDRHYMSFLGNYLAQNDDIIKLDETKNIYGVGVTYSYRSLLGPFEFTTAYSNSYKKLVLSFNLGLWF